MVKVAIDFGSMLRTISGSSVYSRFVTKGIFGEMLDTARFKMELKLVDVC